MKQAFKQNTSLAMDHFYFNIFYKCLNFFLISHPCRTSDFFEKKEDCAIHHKIHVNTSLQSPLIKVYVMTNEKRWENQGVEKLYNLWILD